LRTTANQYKKYTDKSTAHKAITVPLSNTSALWNYNIKPLHFPAWPIFSISASQLEFREKPTPRYHNAISEFLLHICIPFNLRPSSTIV
jgi:hypothetical protein